MNLACSIFFILSLSTPAKKEDRFFAKDKALHIIHSAAIVGLSYHVYHCQLKNPPENSRIFSVSFTSLVGIGKEIYDGVSKKGTASWKDLLADGLGIIIGVLVFTGGG